jgi:hypothetical protein
MKRIYILLLWIVIYFSSQANAMPVNVPNYTDTCIEDTSGSTKPYDMIWSDFNLQDYQAFRNIRKASTIGKSYNTFEINLNGVSSTVPLSTSGVTFDYFAYWNQNNKSNASHFFFEYNQGGYWHSQADDGTDVYIYPLSATINGTSVPWRLMRTYNGATPPSSFFNAGIPAQTNFSFVDGGTGAMYADSETLSTFPLDFPDIDIGTITTSDNKNITFTFALEYADGRDAFSNHPDMGFNDSDWYGYSAIWYYGAPYDYGDADGYAPAGHGVDNCNGSLYLGNVRPDSENRTPTDGVGTATADNSDGILSDEDSITPQNISQNDTNYSIDIPYHNNTNQNALLAGWIDFDNDGLLESNERKEVTVSTGSGTAKLTWNNITVNNSASQLTLRLRIASLASELLTADGLASNGEVEDYTIIVDSSPAGQTCGTEPLDIIIMNDESGSVTAQEYADSLTFLKNLANAIDNWGATGINMQYIGWSNWDNQRDMGLKSNATDFINSLPAYQEKGDTDYEQAVTKATIPALNTARAAARKIVLVITDAHEGKDFDNDPSDDEFAASQLIKDTGASLAFIAVHEAMTNASILNNLRAMASTDAQGDPLLYASSNFTDWHVESFITNLLNGADGICKPPVSPPPPATCPTGVSGAGEYAVGWWHNNPNTTPSANQYWLNYPNDIKSGKDDTVIATAFDETHGSGTIPTISGSYLYLQGIDQSNLAGAIADNDYVEYKFTTANFSDTKYISRYVFTVANGQENDYYPYKFSILVSDKADFSSYINTIDNQTKNGYIPGNPDNPNTPGTHQTYEYNPTEFMLLEPNKTYYMRIYVYDDQSAGANGIIVDDFNFGVDCCTGCGTPFTCTDTFFISNQHNLETASTATDKNWLHSVNRATKPYGFQSIGNGFLSQNGGYNAIGYRIQDNYIYGLYGNNLVKIDRNGTVEELGAIEGYSAGQLYTGEFDRDGYYYITGHGGNDNLMYKIDVVQRKLIETITLSSSVRFWDMAIDKSGDYFYAMLVNDGDADSSFNNDKVVKINISNGQITPVGTQTHANLASYISLVFSDVDGDVFMMSNENGFYKVNTLTGALELLSTTSDLTYYNDGTSCPNADITEPARVYISDEETTEGDSGTKDLLFTVALDKVAGVPVSFKYQIFDGNSSNIKENATVPSDYNASSGSIEVSLDANTQTYEIRVPINGDTVPEEDEQFTLLITDLTGAIEGNLMATGTIVNDDIDLDADNDGILDRDEGVCTKHNYAAGWFSNVPEGTSNQDGYFTDITVPSYTLDGSANDSSVVASAQPSTIGSGLNLTYHLPYYKFKGVNEPNLQAAIADNDYLEYTFTTSNTLNANTYIDRFALWLMQPFVPYKVGIAFSDDNFATSSILVKDFIAQEDPKPQAIPSLHSSTLQANTTYKLRVYLYGTASSDDEILYDDFHFGTCHNRDSDNDAIPDYLDLDSDNDGIPDNIEAQSTNAYIAPNRVFDENGVDTAYNGGFNGTVDTDEDGTPDYLDLDSDNDTIFDIEESGLGNNDSDNDGKTNADVGQNGLDNTSHEHNDSYEDVNGFAYENGQYTLQDSDEDVLSDGSNALPMMIDFDYRDIRHDAMIIDVNDFAAYEGNYSETEFVIPIKLSKPAPKGGVYINYVPQYIENSNVYQDDFADLTIQEYFEPNPINIALETMDSVQGIEALNLAAFEMGQAQELIVQDYDIDIHLHSVNQNDKVSTHTWEPDLGKSRTVQLEVKLNKEVPAGGVVTVQLEPRNITAKEGSDYTRTSSVVYFQAGEQVKYVDYIVNGDVRYEGEEAFEVYLHSPYNANLHKDHHTVQVTIKESITGSYTNKDDSYKRYTNYWIEFLILYEKWKLSPKNVTQYPTFEEYFIKKLDRTVNTSYPQIVDNGIPITESDYQGKQQSQKIGHKSHHYKETNTSNPIVIFVEEGETEANLTILIQGDTIYEENEPFKVLMWTEHADASFIKSNGDMNTSKYTDINLSTEVTLASNETEIVVIILNDDEKSANNIAEFRFDCLDREKYRDFSIFKNDIRTTLLSEKRPNSNILCNTINASSVSGLRIKDHNAYHENNGTISFWMYDTGTIDQNKKILSKGTFSVGTITGSSNAARHIDINLGDGSSLTSTSSYDPNSAPWIFVTITYERGGKIKLYLNGNLDAEGNYDGSFQNDQDIYVGAYDGYIDEFYLFDASMNQDEIVYLYQQQLANINLDGTPRDCGCIQSIPPLLAEYRYDVCYWHGKDKEVIDHSLYKNHLNTKGLIQPHPNGKIHNGPRFDANKTQILGSIEGNVSNEITLSTWIKTQETQTLGTQTPLIELSKSGTSSYTISLGYHTDGQTLVAWSSNENNEKSSAVYHNLESNGFHDNKWHMLTFTYNDGTSKLYVDGVLKHTTVKDIGQLTEVSKITIGSTYDGSVIFDGALDETLIFGEALTANEIDEIYNNTNKQKSWDGSDRNNSICDYPNVTISNPTVKEGDSGVSVMEFKIGLDAAPQIPTDIHYILNDDTATLADNDYQEIESSRVLTFTSNETEKTIRVNIVGDLNIEPTETFSLTLSSPLLTFPNNQNSGIGTIVNDDSPLFAIERDDVQSSNPPTPIDNASMRKKSALYTQVVNKDFDYSIVSYEKNTTGYLETVAGVNDLTLKIELKDVNSTNQDLLYRAYFYVPNNNTNSRFTVANITDLQIPQATRKAKFEVTALLDQNGSIIHGDLTQNNDFDQTIISRNAIEQVGHSDLFAIRPLGYYFEIRDNDEHNNSLYAQNDQDNEVQLAAQYDYKLYLAAITNQDNNVSSHYHLLGNGELNASLSFDDLATCNDTQDGHLQYFNNYQSFKSEDLGSVIENSQLGNITLSHHNVGKYQLEIQDINWTSIDQHNDPDLAGCIMHSSSNIRKNNKYGCNFSSDIYGDFSIDYQAHEFNLSNTQLQNISQNGQKYLYMGSDFNSNKEMGIVLSTNILALGAKGTQLSNYTSSCVAKDVDIDLNYLITDSNVSDESSYAQFTTTKGTVQPLQMIKILNDINGSIVDTHFSNRIDVPKTAFLDSNEGNSSLTLLYNIQKNTSETMNPIHLNFLNLHADANQTKHYIQGEEKTAQGKSGTGLINTERTFYFSRIAPDMENYPATQNSSMSTPLSVEIFCDVNRTWCQEMIPSGIGLNSPHTIYGWYTSRTHQSADGTFSLNVDDVKINPNDGTSPLTPPAVKNKISLNEDLTTTDGRFYDTTVSFQGGFANNDEQSRSVSVEVRVTPDPWLRYHPDTTRMGDPYYNVTFKNGKFGTLTGVGESGSMINLDANNEKSNKLSW